MTKVTFFQNLSGNIQAFKVSGHSGYAESGKDIVCAAVSSAVIMTVNTVTDVIMLNADVTENDGVIEMTLSEKEAEKAKDILAGLRLHLVGLADQYPKYLKVKNSEV